jgi:para-nitrobenzyl esterase
VPWTGIKACIEYSDYSYQNPAATLGPYTAEFRPDLDKVPSEDSLYLNIWTKRVSTEKRLVIVYIHGGGNNTGYSGTFAYEGENIA